MLCHQVTYQPPFQVCSASCLFMGFQQQSHNWRVWLFNSLHTLTFLSVDRLSIFSITYPNINDTKRVNNVTNLWPRKYRSMQSMQLVSVITVYVSLVTQLLMLYILMFLTLTPHTLCFFWIKVHRMYNTAVYTISYLTCLLTLFCLPVNSNTKVWQIAASHCNTGHRQMRISGGLLLTFTVLF